jgi:plastocyanin
MLVPAHPTRRRGAWVLALFLAGGGLVAACGGGSPTASPAPTDAQPTPVEPTPVLTPVPTAAGPDADVVITALNIEFTPAEAAAPADAPFTLALVHRDAGIPHGIEIRDAAGRSAWRSAIVTGPASPVFDVPALEAGSYQFVCPVHPNMVGTLTVGG